MNHATAVIAGPVLAGLLWHRQALSLHASVVSVGSRAVVLLADKAVGKSTLAAALSQRSLAVLADDVAALTELPDGGWFCEPGYPRLRLTPGAAGPARTQFADPLDAGPVTPGSRKRYVALSTDPTAPAWRFEPERLPVAAIYELRRSPGLRRAHAGPLSGARGFATLLRHARPALLPLSPASQVEGFERVSRLAGKITIRQLSMPDDLDALDGVCKALIGDVTRLSRANGRAA